MGAPASQTGLSSSTEPKEVSALTGFDPSRIRPLEMLAFFGDEFERLGAVAARYGLPNVQWAVRPTKLLYRHRLIERMTGSDCGRWRITDHGRAKLTELATQASAKGESAASKAGDAQ